MTGRTATSTHTSGSVSETEQIGARLAASLEGGGVVALSGELGAGKTQFVRGLVRGLGGDARQVHSPTFVLMHEYPCGGRRLFHLDAYRVGAAEMEAIGFEELVASTEEGDVVAIEWAEKIGDLLPQGAIRVEIRIVSVGRREVRISGGSLQGEGG